MLVHLSSRQGMEVPCCHQVVGLGPHPKQSADGPKPDRGFHKHALPLLQGALCSQTGGNLGGVLGEGLLSAMYWVSSRTGAVHPDDTLSLHTRGSGPTLRNAGGVTQPNWSMRLSRALVERSTFEQQRTTALADGGCPWHPPRRNPQVPEQQVCCH